jgi:hypothetical protein
MLLLGQQGPTPLRDWVEWIMWHEFMVRASEKERERESTRPVAAEEVQAAVVAGGEARAVAGPGEQARAALQRGGGEVRPGALGRVVEVEVGEEAWQEEKVGWDWGGWVGAREGRRTVSTRSAFVSLARVSKCIFHPLAATSTSHQHLSLKVF